MTPIKLLVTTYSFPPAYADGGPVQSGGDLVKALVDEGVDVTVLTTNRNGNSTLNVPLGVPVDWNGAKVYYFQIQKPWWYGFAPSCVSRVIAEVGRCDILHSMAIFSFLPDFSAAIASCMSKPYVVSPRGNLSPVALEKGFLKKRIYYNLLTRHLLNRAGSVHCMTPTDAAWASEFGVRSSVVCVPNGIDFQFLHGKTNSEIFFVRYPELVGKQIIMFLGRLDPIKGLDLLLEAWALVAHELPNAVLVLVGPDTMGYQDKLECLARKLGVTDRVKFVGEWTGTDKHSILSAADLFVMPSYSENFGLAIAEALAVGVPVLASDRCAIVSYLEHGKDIWTAPCAKENFAEAIKNLVNDLELRKALVGSGKYKAAELFHIKNVALTMMSVYKDAMDLKIKRKLTL